MKSTLNVNAPQGLTTNAAKANFIKYGPNRLTPPKQTSEWIIFMRNVFSYFGILLWIGATLCFIAYGIQVINYENPQKDNV